MIDGVPLTWLDAGAILIVLASAALAFWRGLTREVFSVGGWAAAAFATLYGLPYARPYMRDKIETLWIADGLTAVGIFVVTLVAAALVTHRFGSAVRASSLNAVDRSLGFVFGAARGALLASLAWLIVAWLWPEPTPEELEENPDKARPEWIQLARTKPVLEWGGATLMELVPKEEAEAIAAEAEKARREAEEAIEAKEALERLTVPAPDAGAPSEDGGYSNRSRDQLDRLYETVN